MRPTNIRMEAAAELDRRTTRDAIDDGPKHEGLFPSPYDHRAARSTVLFNGRSPDHQKKSPGKVSPSPSSAAAVGFLCVGGAATAGASSSTCGQARRVCASAAALGWGGGCSAPAVHHPSTPPHCTSWGRRLVPFLLEAPKTCARTALKRRSVGSSRPAGGDPHGSLDAACRAAVPCSVAQDLHAGGRSSGRLVNGTRENHRLHVIKGKHVIYKGIDISTGEVVSKFYEGIPSQSSTHSVRYSSQPNGYQTATVVPASTRTYSLLHTNTPRASFPSPLKGTRAVAYAQRSARG